MALDASIISGVKPLNLAQPDPLERYVKLAGVQEITGKLADQERTRADEEAVRDAYRQSGGDSAVLRKLLTDRGSYKQIQALDKADYERRQAESTITRNTAQGQKATWEVESEKMKLGAALWDGVKDADSFEQVLRFGELRGFYKPEAVAQARAQGYSPQLVAMMQNAGLTRAQQLEEQNRVAVRGETGRHNLATEAGTIRGQNITAGTAREGHAVTRRGQDLTNARALEQNDPTAVARRAEAQAYGKETGESRATAQATLPQVVANAERGIRLVDELVGSKDGTVRRHPGFSTAVGVSGMSGGFGAAGYVPGTDTSDFKARFEEIQGGTFMQAFQSLRGGGQITEQEGQKATAAITRMKLAQSEKEFVTAAREFQDVVREGVRQAKLKATAPARGPSVNPSSLSDAELKRELGL